MIELVVWINTGEIYLNAYYPDFNEDCSPNDTRSVQDFSGSMQNDSSRTYIRWEKCSSADPAYRASGTAVMDALVSLSQYNENLFPYDEVFIGGATCDRGNATDGSTWSFDFTLYYRGEYQPYN